VNRSSQAAEPLSPIAEIGTTTIQVKASSLLISISHFYKERLLMPVLLLSFLSLFFLSLSSQAVAYSVQNGQ
jgi:hypothetical protein